MEKSQVSTRTILMMKSSKEKEDTFLRVSSIYIFTAPAITTPWKVPSMRLKTISKTIAEHGTTTFLPTTMTVDTKEIRKAVEAAKVAQGQVSGASIGGVHLEGPFISEGAIGAQNPKYVQKPTLEAFKEMVGNNLDLIKNITMAPEVEGALELIPYLRENGINVAMGHSVATYEQAMEGIRAGVNHSTHLFNAMTPFTHREPGVVGAVFDTDITTETISDGIHVSYPSLRNCIQNQDFR